MAARRDLLLIGLIASVIALVSARPFIGCANDASRLATVECLVDYNTFAIDRSIFTKQTDDRMLIGGRFYSDKSPVTALPAAGLYKILQAATGITAQSHTGLFCWWIHLTNAGFPYVVSVVAMFLIAGEVGLSRRVKWALTLAFALATMASAYAKVTNCHIQLLGLTSLLIWLQLRLAKRLRRPVSAIPIFALASLGFLAGLAYATDLGAGPIISLGVGLWLLYRIRQISGTGRRLTALLAFGLAALPCVAAYHALNYSISGAVGPAGANPEVFQWPGSRFHAGNMTGHWNHHSFSHFLSYSFDIAYGQRGFVSNNLMLYIAIVGLPLLFRSKVQELPEVLCGLFWCSAIFLMYAALSINYGGGGISIRWFVPLLAPGFLVLALLLRQRPALMADFTLLSGWSLVWALVAWWYGPWWYPPLAVYWVVLSCGQCQWAALHFWRFWMGQGTWHRHGFLNRLMVLGGSDTVTGSPMAMSRGTHVLDQELAMS